MKNKDLGAFANVKTDLHDADLNDIKETCCFNVSASDASTVANLPVVNNAVRCFVINVGRGNDKTCIQAAWTYGGELYYRTYWSGGSFRPWKRLLSTDA